MVGTGAGYAESTPLVLSEVAGGVARSLNASIIAPVTRGIPDSPLGCNVGSSRAGTGARPVTGPPPAASGSIRQHDRIGSGRVRKIAPVRFGPGETSARESRPVRTGRSREAWTRSDHTLEGGRPGWSRQTGRFARSRRRLGPGVPRTTRISPETGPVDRPGLLLASPPGSAQRCAQRGPIGTPGSRAGGGGLDGAGNVCPAFVGSSGRRRGPDVTLLPVACPLRRISGIWISCGRNSQPVAGAQDISRRGQGPPSVARSRWMVAAGLVELSGIEPLASAVRLQRSPI